MSITITLSKQQYTSLVSALDNIVKQANQSIAPAPKKKPIVAEKKKPVATNPIEVKKPSSRKRKAVVLA